MKNSKIIRVGILPTAILLLMLVFQPARIVLSSLGAALLHELGHITAAAMLGIPLRSLDVGMFGASLKVRGSLISYSKEFLLCAAGPAMNFLSAIFVIALSERRGYFTELGEWFASVSLMLGILNLIPADGFDGGRMLSVAVASLFGPRAAARLLYFTTFLSILILWMLSVWLLIRFGTSLSLFVFTLSLFYRLFIEKA
jgi:membrane-associated protease RseP (regulator of RpoE activity)